jgi:hypothetical protein
MDCYIMRKIRGFIPYDDEMMVVMDKRRGIGCFLIMAMDTCAPPWITDSSFAF